MKSFPGNFLLLAGCLVFTLGAWAGKPPQAPRPPQAPAPPPCWVEPNFVPPCPDGCDCGCRQGRPCGCAPDRPEGQGWQWHPRGRYWYRTVPAPAWPRRPVPDCPGGT